MRENRILVILGAVLFGAALGAFFASKRRKEPDAVQAVRDWLEKTLEEFSKQWPKAKKQARLPKMISSPRLRVSARSCISGLARPAPTIHLIRCLKPHTQSQQVMFLPNAPAEVYEEWRRNAMRRRCSPRFFPLSLCSD